MATTSPTVDLPSWWRIPAVLYGLLLIVFGIAALLMPLVATLAASMTFGSLLFASGVLGVLALVADRGSNGFWWRAIWVAVAIVAGLCILIHPWEGALSLTLILAISLLVQGVVAIIHALQHRLQAGSAWVWMGVAGVLTSALGVVLLLMLPHAGRMIPGLFLAVNLVSFGMSVVASGIANARCIP
jgi:uncharacterized membrane protein HdeD (DUF308 family)